MELLVEFFCPYIPYDSVGANDAVVFSDAIWQPTGGKG